ncbi:bifunctional indole-3-glycerol-phosphate synthase TrpC/phosphoribosylanthranilate isomerase TrpF [Orbaceae bacterium ac157xtp]
MVIQALTEHITMATVLKKIVKDKIEWIAERKQKQPLSTFEHKITKSDRDFYQALTSKHSVFILECKKASPSKGLIRDDFNPETIAKIYKNHANAISVLTDEKYFQGSFDFLPIVKKQTHQPILCKDFIVDKYQIYLARYYQADAILLMLSVLNDAEYQQLSELAHSLHMGVLTEASTQQEVERAIKLHAKVIGINNRNLHDLTVDPNRVKQLAPQIPKDRIVISESGIYTHKQVLELSHYAQGFLIGSALMSQSNLEFAIRKVILGENKVCGLTKKADAIAVYQAGAIYGGLIFVPTSSRYITPINARHLQAAAQLNWVGVFQNEQVTNVATIAKSLNLFAVQLHGEEDDNYITQLRHLLPEHCQIWKALSVTDVIPKQHLNFVDRYLFDHGKGGTGKTFDWQLLTNINLDQTMLAGGINSANATQAMQTGVIGLDINSGIESAPGVKDHTKLQQLFTHLRSYPF